MCDYEWINELNQMAKADSWYQARLTEVNNLETTFLSFRSSLTPEQREELDNYISACEELEHALVLLAYRLGQKHATLML